MNQKLIEKAARYGVICVSRGEVSQIKSRWLPTMPSLWDVWLDSYWRRLPNDCFQVYYNEPRSNPGFIILSYAVAGRRTSLSTIHAGMLTLEEIGRYRNARAIVCHASNRRLSERVLQRFGYMRHAIRLKGDNYIKRLND